MRRGRYGNRVSFKVTMELPPVCSVEELRQFIDTAIWDANNTFRFGIQSKGFKVEWPVDRPGRTKNGTEVGSEQ